MASAYDSISATVLNPLRWYLTDPLNPGTGLALSLAPGLLQTISTDRQQIVPVLSRPDPVVLSDAFGLPQITLPLVFLDDATYQAFEDLRATQHILLLRGPYPAGQWYVRLGATKADSTLLTSLRYLNPGDVVRNVTLTAQAVAAP